MLKDHINGLCQDFERGSCAGPTARSVSLRRWRILATCMRARLQELRLRGRREAPWLRAERPAALITHPVLVRAVLRVGHVVAPRVEVLGDETEVELGRGHPSCLSRPSPGAAATAGCVALPFGRSVRQLVRREAKLEEPHQRNHLPPELPRGRPRAVKESAWGAD
jgi:hypothetical protein